MVHDNFIKKLNQESPEFSALMNVLVPIQGHAEEGRRLLCIVNHIMDYYILHSSEDDEDVKMPIIYFPFCEEWAQNLCEDFVALKMSLLFGNNIREENAINCRLHPNMVIPPNITRLQLDLYKQQYQIKKNINKYLPEDLPGYPAKDNERCFLYSRYICDQRVRSGEMKRHYHFVNDFIGTEMTDFKRKNRKNKSIFTTNKSLALIDQSEKELYHAIEENDGDIKVPHIFLFLQRDMDGRNTQLGMQLQRSTINEYNEDYDTGVRNVFFFVFSQKPYRLQRVYENKHNLVERLQREKVALTRDFISFTNEEMDYVFNRSKQDLRILELPNSDESEQRDIKMAFDLILQDLHHEVKLRNELAICFTAKAQAYIIAEILEMNPEANEEYVDYFIRMLNDKYSNYIENKLFEWINFRQVGVILDYNIDQRYKSELVAYLKDQCGATNVSLYTFKDLKTHKENGEFVNSVRENQVLVLSMLNHCTGRNWAIYPNSFDQIALNRGQNALQINNMLVFDPRFSWYQYRYNEQQKLIMNSDFRTKYVRSSIQLPAKPTISTEPRDDEDDLDVRSRQSSRDQVRYTIAFSGKQHRTLDEDDLLLCKNEDELFIYSVADVDRIYEDPTVLEVQPLQDFFQSLELIVDSKERKIGEGEAVIRNNPKYDLSDEERLSKRELWKTLLEHRVIELGEHEVYNSIMQPLLPMERIQMNSFKRWLDPTEVSILPRSRKLQRRVIVEYLGMEPLYTQILRHRKSRTSTNTEGRNSIYKTFLTHCLLETDMKKAYSSLSYEVRDYFNITSGNDIKLIVDLILDEELKLRPIKSILL